MPHWRVGPSARANDLPTFLQIYLFAMNVELLAAVRQAVVHYPDRFSAAQWAFARNAAAVRVHGVRPEGFRCCIAGHVLLQGGIYDERALLTAGGFHTGGAVWKQAAAALELDDDGCRELFFPSQWDKPYKQNYYLCSCDEEAEVVAAYLDYFMQKYGSAASSSSVEDVSTPSRTRSSETRASVMRAKQSA